MKVKKVKKKNDDNDIEEQYQHTGKASLFLPLEIFPTLSWLPLLELVFSFIIPRRRRRKTL